MAAEAAHKLDTPSLSFDKTGLHAVDFIGHARTSQSLVGGGIDDSKTAGISGLLIE